MTARTTSQFVTVGDITYPAGTKTSDIDFSRVEYKASDLNSKAFAEDTEVTASVGAGAYDDTKVWTKDALTEEINKRNAALPDESKIEPQGANRGDLVAALEQYDQNHVN